MIALQTEDLLSGIRGRHIRCGIASFPPEKYALHELVRSKRFTARLGEGDGDGKRGKGVNEQTGLRRWVV